MAVILLGIPRHDSSAFEPMWAPSKVKSCSVTINLRKSFDLDRNLDSHTRMIKPDVVIQRAFESTNRVSHVTLDSPAIPEMPDWSLLGGVIERSIEPLEVLKIQHREADTVAHKFKELFIATAWILEPL